MIELFLSHRLANSVTEVLLQSLLPNLDDLLGLFYHCLDFTLVFIGHICVK